MRGAYRPSPGSVYPTLQMLEDLGYVTSSQQEGKKVYSITDEGRRHLDEQQSTLDDIRSRVSAGWEAASRPEAVEVMHELRELGRVLFQQATRGALNDPDRLRHLTAILRRARSEIEASSYQPTASGPSASPPEPEERMI
jgi:DNA-binding PadR family transcriptional regulator